MKNKFFIYITFFLLLFSFNSCSDDSVDYREKIIGDWELKNIGELQSYYAKNSFILKNAIISFSDDGKVRSQLTNKKNPKEKIINQGEWEMPKKGGLIRIISEDSPFNDFLKIDFSDERTFFLVLNGIEYQFVKI